MFSLIPNPAPVLRAVLVAVAVSLLPSSDAPAATITFVGVEPGTAGSGYAVQNWSNAGVAKEFDLSGNVYGTAGYYQIRPTLNSSPSDVYEAVASGNNLGITAGTNPTLYSAPVFLSSITGGAGTYVNFGGYPLFRGPDGSTLYRQGSLSVSVGNGLFNTPSGANTGYYGDAFSFTMASGFGANFRIGIAVDTAGTGTYAPDYVSIYNSGTGSVFSSLLTRNGTPDMTVFDVSASAGESFAAAMWQLAGTQSVSPFGLITFDVSRYNFDVGSGLSQTNSVSLGGAPAGVLKTGAGTLVMASSNSAAGGALVSGGTLVMAAGSVLGGNITNNSTLVFDGAHGGVANAVSGTGSLVKSGAGIATFYASNSYAGATVVSGGQLMLGGAGAIPTGSAVDIASGASINLTGYYAPGDTNRTIGGLTGAGILYGSGGTVTVNKASGSDNFSGDIQGGQGLIKSGSGTLVLSGSNSYTGGTLIAGGTLAINDGGSVNGGITNNADLSINATLPNVVSGTGSLTKTGAAVAYLWSANTYSGATMINEGQITLGGAGAISTNTLHIASGAAINLTGAFAAADINRTIGGLTGAGILYGSGGTVTVNKASGSDTFSGDIQSGQGLVKTGSGTLVLSGANSYTGATSVNGGTLGLHGSSSSLQITVAGGASLDLSAALTATASGAVVFNTGSSVSVSGTPSGDAVTLLTASGGITGTPSLVPVAGYSLVTTGNSLILQAAAGSTYAAWLGTNSPTPQLMQNYAFGAVTPTNAVNTSNLPVYGTAGGQFVLNYSVRADDTNLVVEPQVNGDLTVAAGWTTNGVLNSVIGTNIVEGVEMQQRQASVPLTGSKKFLRLRITE